MSKKNKTWAEVRRRMWLRNPLCENCGVLTFLPELIDGKINNKDGSKQMKIFYSNMATIQHKYDRLHPLRMVAVKGRRIYLFCHHCNQQDNLDQKIIRLKRQFNQNKPI